MRAWRPGFGTKRGFAGFPVPLAARVLLGFDDVGCLRAVGSTYARRLSRRVARMVLRVVFEVLAAADYPPRAFTPPVG